MSSNIQLDWSEHCRVSGWVRNQRWRSVTGSGNEITYISEIITKFQRLYLCFRCQATEIDWLKHSRLSGWVSNQRWRSVTGSGYGLTYILAGIHAWQLKFFNEYTYVFGVKHRYWTNPNTLPHLMGLWSIFRIYPLPVTGRHLWYKTHSDIGQYSHKCSYVARSQKHRYNRWNFVTFLHSCATRYFICTSGSRLPSLISHWSRQTVVFRSDQSCFLTSTSYA